MRVESAFKVGVFLVVAIMMAVGLWRFLNDPKRKQEGYELKVVVANAQGIVPGTSLRMSGIAIGHVEATELDARNRAVFIMRINKNVKVYKGSHFRVALDNLLGQKVVEVVPPQHPGGRVYREGQVIVVRETDPQINDLLIQANNAMLSINALLKDVRGVVADANLQGSVPRMLEQFTEVGAELRLTAATVRGIIENSRGNVAGTMTHVESLAGKADAMADTLEDILKDAKNTTAQASRIMTDPELEQTLKTMMQDLKASTATIRESVQSLGNLVQDEELQGDIKGAVKDARTVMATANTTMDDAQDAIESFTGLIEAVNKLEVKPTFEMRYETSLDKIQSDMNLRLAPKGSELYYDIGLDDVGEASSTNLMLGFQARPDTWVSGGLKGGKLGLGMEFERSPEQIYRLELVDPNNLRVNLRGSRKISDKLFLQAGMEDMVGDDRFSLGLVQRY